MSSTAIFYFSLKRTWTPRSFNCHLLIKVCVNLFFWSMIILTIFKISCSWWSAVKRSCKCKIFTIERWIKRNSNEQVNCFDMQFIVPYFRKMVNLRWITKNWFVSLIMIIRKKFSVKQPKSSRDSQSINSNTVQKTVLFDLYEV